MTDANIGDPRCQPATIVQRDLNLFAAGVGRTRLGVRSSGGWLLHFDRIGYVVVASSLFAMIAMYFVQKPIAWRAGRRRV